MEIIDDFKPNQHVSADMFPFDPKRHYLGSLCKEQHAYDNTGQTLRRLTKTGATGACYVCERQIWQEKVRLKKIEQHKTQPYVTGCECNSCRTEIDRRAEARKERKYETTKAFFERNPDYHKDWYEKNREQHLERRHEWYQQNKEKALAQCRAYREANREEINKRERVRHKTEKYKLTEKAYKQRRRASERKPGTVPYTSEEWRQRVAEFSHECAYCGGDCSMSVVTLEHVIPLSDPRGFDSLSNIIPACKDCNCYRKQAKRMVHWYPEQPFFTIERYDKILSVIGENEFNAILEDFSSIDF